LGVELVKLFPNYAFGPIVPYRNILCIVCYATW